MRWRAATADPARARLRRPSEAVPMGDLTKVCNPALTGVAGLFWRYLPVTGMTADKDGCRLLPQRKVTRCPHGPQRSRRSSSS